MKTLRNISVILIPVVIVIGFMASTTPDGNLILIDRGNVDGYTNYNESMYYLAAMIKGASDKDAVEPDGVATSGDLYIVPASATNDFAVDDATTSDLAYYFAGAWHFYTPEEGWMKWINDEDCLYVYNSTSWVQLATATP